MGKALYDRALYYFKDFDMKLLLLTLLCLIPTVAIAQGNQVFVRPGDEYVNETLEMLKAQQKQIESNKGYIKPQTLYVSTVKHDYFEDEQFGILIDTGDIITGCWKLSPLEYEASFTEQYYMDVKVKHYKRDPIDGDCPKGNQTVSALLVLNKADLQKRGIKQIRFSNDVAQDRYEVAFYNDRIELKPLTQIAFKANGLAGSDEDRIIHYDGQKGVIALHVPMAKKGDALSNAMLSIARRNNLEPLDAHLSKRYNPKQSTFFFMDSDGSITNKLGSDHYTEIGVIDVKRPYDGPYGRTEVDTPLKVFATLPGKTL